MQVRKQTACPVVGVSVSHALAADHFVLPKMTGSGRVDGTMTASVSKGGHSRGMQQCKAECSH